MPASERAHPAVRVAKLLALVIVLVVLVAAGRVLTHKVIEPALGLVVANLVAIGLAGLFVWLVLHRLAGAQAAEMGYTTQRLGLSITLGLVGAAAVTAMLLGILGLWWGLDVARAQWQELLDVGILDRLPFILVGLAAAIAEEPLFRGYLQPRLIERLGYAGGLLATAALFTLAHPRVYRGHPDLILGLFLTGLIYGLLRGRDRPLLGPAVAHVMTWVIWAGN